MLLNQAETWLMNNPLRAAMQRYYEVPTLLRLGGSMRGGRVLEVGCGRGYGVELLLDHLGAGQVDAFDLDPAMITRARARLAPRGDRVRLWTGSVTEIASGDAAYDAVMDFGIIHHVPDWRRALREVYRVLKPGGRFYVEEMFELFICNPIARRLFDHPQQNRFDSPRFTAGLKETGFQVMTTHPVLSLYGWFVADRPA
ncbi:MAG: class I SAM-dependent methyltransferase [bacterium]